MKKILAQLLALFLFSSHAFAAISVGDAAAGTYSTPPGSVTGNNAASVGDALFVGVPLSTSSTVTVTCADGSGSYTSIGSPLFDSTNSRWIQWFWRVATVSGIPTVSCTLSAAQAGELQYIRVTGFGGTPTLDSGLTLSYSTTGTTVAYNVGNTAHADEIVLATFSAANGNTFASTPSGWTLETGSLTGGSLGQSFPTSGTAVSINGTVSVGSGGMDIQAIGVYDSGGGGSCAHSGFATSGTVSIPNGTSGTYMLANGTRGTPDCSTVKYCNTSGTCSVN